MIKAVPTAEVPQVWPDVKHWLEASPIFNKVERQVAAGEYTLLLHPNGCAVVTKMPPNTMFIVEIGGKELVTDTGFKELCEYAKSAGSENIKAAATPAAARLYRQIGMTTTHELMECVL